MLWDKLLGPTCIGVIVATMSAINEEFRQRLVTLASGGFWMEASSYSSRTMKWTAGMMDIAGAYGGDSNWLLALAVGAAVVGSVWMLKW